MTNPHGDAAISAQKSGADQVRDGASQNAFGEVLKEQMSSDNGKWSSKPKEEPLQLVFSDPYKNIGSVKDLMQLGTMGDGKMNAPGSKMRLKVEEGVKAGGDEKMKVGGDNRDGDTPDANSDGKKYSGRLREFRGMSLDNQGKYEFKENDTVWGMAEKLARHAAKGESPTTENTINELNKLLAANKERYPGVDENPGMIKPGMKLDIPATETHTVTDKIDDEPVPLTPHTESGMNLSDGSEFGMNLSDGPRNESGMSLTDDAGLDSFGNLSAGKANAEGEHMSADDKAWMNFIGNDPEQTPIKVPEKGDYKPYAPTSEELGKLADEVRFLRGGALGSELQQVKPAQNQPRQNRRGFAGTSLPPLSAR